MEDAAARDPDYLLENGFFREEALDLLTGSDGDEVSLREAIQEIDDPARFVDSQLFMDKAVVAVVDDPMSLGFN